MPTRTVRIYVSSVYRDMRVERKVLHRVVFPELRRRCATLGIEVIKVDPCWHVSEAEAEGEGALARRFKQLEQCKPYFIGLFGSRSGRRVDSIPKEMLKSHHWLIRHQGASLNELEVRRSLRTKFRTAPRQFFYFRIPSLDPGDPLRPDSRLLRLVTALEDAKLRVQRYPWRWENEQIAGLDEFAWRVIEDLWNAIYSDFGPAVSRESRVDATAPTVRNANPTPRVDDNVQFTTYAPKSVVPGKWYSLLAFAHLADLPDNAVEEAEPIDDVRRQAEGILGEQRSQYQERQRDSRAAIPSDGEITFLPRVPGIEITPARRRFRWLGKTHHEIFELRAPAYLDGRAVRGSLSVFLGSILLAEIGLTINVHSGTVPARRELPTDRTSARAYRKIFASYSHKDRLIVEQFERYGTTLGDSYLRDWINLRSGEVWTDKLEQMIAEADIFQLFWSSNSMLSPFVEREWRFALSLKRHSFVRPTYWEAPLPQAPERNLPPLELRRLHFKYVGLDELAAPQRLSADGTAEVPASSLDWADTVRLNQAEIEAARRRLEEEKSSAADLPTHSDATPESITPRADHPALGNIDLDLPKDLTAQSLPSPAPLPTAGDGDIEVPPAASAAEIEIDGGSLDGIDLNSSTAEMGSSAKVRRGEPTEDELILADEIERQRLDDEKPPERDPFDTKEQTVGPAPKRESGSGEIGGHPSLGGLDIELPPRPSKRDSVTRRPPSEDSFEMTAYIGLEGGSDTEIDVTMSDAEVPGQRRLPNPTEEQFIIAAELERRRQEAEDPSTEREVPIPVTPERAPSRAAPPPASLPRGREIETRASRVPAAREREDQADADAWRSPPVKRSQSFPLFWIALVLMIGAGIFAGLWIAGMLPWSGRTPSKQSARAQNVDPSALASARLFLDSDQPARAVAALEKLDRESPAVLAALGQARWLKYQRENGQNKLDMAATEVVQARKELREALTKWQATKDMALEAEAVRAVIWQGLIEKAFGNVEQARELYTREAGQFSEANRAILQDAAAQLKTGGGKH